MKHYGVWLLIIEYGCKLVIHIIDRGLCECKYRIGKTILNFVFLNRLF